MRTDIAVAEDVFDGVNIFLLRLEPVAAEGAVRKGANELPLFKRPNFTGRNHSRISVQ